MLYAFGWRSNTKVTHACPSAACIWPLPSQRPVVQNRGASNNKVGSLASMRTRYLLNYQPMLQALMLLQCRQSLKVSTERVEDLAVPEEAVRGQWERVVGRCQRGEGIATPLGREWEPGEPQTHLISPFQWEVPCATKCCKVDGTGVLKMCPANDRFGPETPSKPSVRSSLLQALGSAPLNSRRVFSMTSRRAMAVCVVYGVKTERDSLKSQIPSRCKKVEFHCLIPGLDLVLWLL